MRTFNSRSVHDYGGHDHHRINGALRSHASRMMRHVYVYTHPLMLRHMEVFIYCTYTIQTAAAVNSTLRPATKLHKGRVHHVVHTRKTGHANKLQQ